MWADTLEGTSRPEADEIEGCADVQDLVQQGLGQGYSSLHARRCKCRQSTYTKHRACCADGCTRAHQNTWHGLPVFLGQSG